MSSYCDVFILLFLNFHIFLFLQYVEELLDFFERYQQKWVFLSKMFYETTVSIQKAELVSSGSLMPLPQLPQL